MDDSSPAILENFTPNMQIVFDSAMDIITFEDIENLNRAEKVRSLVINSLRSFKTDYSDKTAHKLCEGLYNLLITLGTDKKLIELADKLEEWEEVSYSAEQIRLWEILVTTLDRTAEVIGDREHHARFRQVLPGGTGQCHALDLDFHRAVDQQR